jgi:hypothetical protein
MKAVMPPNRCVSSRRTASNAGFTEWTSLLVDHW